MRIFLTSAFLFLHFLNMVAGDIRGVIKNSYGENLEFATIHISGTNRGTTTDANGSFLINNLKKGNHKLLVSSVNHKNHIVDVVVSSDDIYDLQTIVLEPSSLQLNEVVVSGIRKNYVTQKPSTSIRLDQPLLEVPQNIQVISSSVIADQQILSMSDGITRNVSGLTRLEHWGDLYTRINTRGSRASAFREGMNVMSNWGPLTEDMSVVESIEFVKGPSGFMMSNGEPSGIYNVVTKKPTGHTKRQAGLTLGSYDLYRATLDLDGKLDGTGKLLYRVNLMGQLKNSFRQGDFNDRYSIAPVISYEIDDNTKLTAQYTYQHVSMANLGAYYSFSMKGYEDLPRKFTALAPGIEPTKISDHSLILNLQHRLSNEWKLTTQGAYFNYQQEGSSMWADTITTNGDLRRTASIWDALSVMKFGQVFLNGDFRTGPVRHHVLTGVDLGNKEYWADWGQSVRLENTIGAFNIYNPTYGTPELGYPQFDRNKSLKERSNGTVYALSYYGLYLQDELGFFADKLRLTLAGRFTYVRDKTYGTTLRERHFSPRVGLSYSIDDNISVYALYDQTFVPQGGLRRDGKSMKPQTGNNMELGLKKMWFDGRVSTTLAAYRIINDNQSVADPENTPSENYVIDMGQIRNQGVEFDLYGEIVKGLDLIANYAFTESKVTKSISEYPKGTSLPGVAKHNINATLKYKFSNKLLNGFSLQLAGTSQMDRTSWWTPNSEDTQNLPDYFKLDAGAGWTNGKLTVGLNVGNVLDKYLYSGSPFSIGSIPAYFWQTESPRNYRFNITYNF